MASQFDNAVTLNNVYINSLAQILRNANEDGDRNERDKRFW